MDEESGTPVRREERAVRTCVVCFDNPITTVTLPCRHSSACVVCMQEIRRSTNKCPICRARIASIRHGHYDNAFVDFASLAVEAVQDRVETANTYVFSTMYDRVRAFMLLGLLFAAISGASFLVLGQTIVGVFFVILALIVGYVPWFTVTVNAFERVDEASDGPRCVRRFVWREDCRRPLTLVLKLVALIVILPFAMVIFFVPYAFFALFVRPFFKHVLPFVAWLMLMILIGCCCSLYQGITTVVTFIGKCLRWLYARLLMPIGNCVRAVYLCIVVPICRGIANFFRGCIHYAKVLCVALHRCICIPIGKCLCDCFKAMKRCGFAMGSAAYRSVLSPTGRCVRSCAHSFAWALSRATDLAYQHVLAPVGRGMWTCISALCHGLWLCGSSCAWALSRLAGLAFQHVLAPMGRSIWTCISAVCHGLWFCGSSCAWALSRLAGLAYQHVLEPIRNRTSACIATACELLRRCVSSIAWAIAQAAGVVCEYVLTPIGRGLTACFCSLGDGLRCCARNIAWAVREAVKTCFAYVLVPTASWLRFLVRAQV